MLLVYPPSLMCLTNASEIALSALSLLIRHQINMRYVALSKVLRSATDTEPYLKRQEYRAAWSLRIGRCSSIIFQFAGDVFVCQSLQ